MRKINPKTLESWVGTLGYEILEEIIAPMIGAEEIMYADLYLVDIGVYTTDEKMTKKVIDKIWKKYKIKERVYKEFAKDWSIANIVLLILEDGEYGKP